MDRILGICLAATMLAMTAAQTVLPANFTSSTANLQNDDSIKLSVSRDDKMVPMASVLGLTVPARTGIPPTGLSDAIIIANPSNQATLQSNQIALISCDAYSGFLGPIDVLQSAETANVTAVLFYTTQKDFCDLQGYNGPYTWIYSMKSAVESSALVQAVNNNNGPVYAAIGEEDTVRAANGTSNGGSPAPSVNGSNSNNPLGPSPTTAVAMIILYAITGVITLLFLVIIITGAFRAHRHPERYGPRNGGILGRTRQSRARGLARAMLDTLPIVKFGEREEPKPADVELANTTARETAATETQDTTAQDTNTEAEPTAQTQTRRQSAENGIAAATTTTDDTFANPDHIGCSICTEDFETGQDQRVLPCDHRFHPECIDPWLLNVSGTCPLCRIDLRPTTSHTSDTAASNEEGSNGSPVVLQEGQFDTPPLAPQDTPNERQRVSVRRSIALGLMGIRRPERTTREERLQALRRLRLQRATRERREEGEGVVVTEEEERRTRRRLRDVLGIRTRRTESRVEQQEGSAAGSSQEVVSRDEST